MCGSLIHRTNKGAHITLLILSSAIWLTSALSLPSYLRGQNFSFWPKAIESTTTQPPAWPQWPFTLRFAHSLFEQQTLYWTVISFPEHISTHCRKSLSLSYVYLLSSPTSITSLHPTLSSVYHNPTTPFLFPKPSPVQASISSMSPNLVHLFQGPKHTGKLTQLGLVSRYPKFCFSVHLLDSSSSKRPFNVIFHLPLFLSYFYFFYILA